jgi:hypothetical protein
MSITYNITTSFAAKDTLPSGDSGKIVKGTELTTEFQSIKTAFTLAAPTASPTFTGITTVNSLTIGGTAVTATAAELNILDGVTATTAELNTLDGITATVTELNYVDGVTSNVQTQLDTKAPTASPTFTGTVTVPVAVFNGSIEEQVYELTGTAIDPTNGTIQYKTLGANTTFTESLSNGEYVMLMIDDGTGYTVTWPTTTWVGGSAPTLETTGYNVIALWKVGTTLYGVFSGAA